MPKGTNLKRAATELAATRGINYTAALRELRVNGLTAPANLPEDPAAAFARVTYELGDSIPFPPLRLNQNILIVGMPDHGGPSTVLAALHAQCSESDLVSVDMIPKGAPHMAGIGLMHAEVMKMKSQRRRAAQPHIVLIADIDKLLVEDTEEGMRNIRELSDILTWGPQVDVFVVATTATNPVVTSPLGAMARLFTRRIGTRPSTFILPKQAEGRDALPLSAPFNVEAVSGCDGLPFGVTADGLATLAVGEHLLLAGRAGGGKSVAVQNLVAAAVMKGYDVHVVDLERGGADYLFAAAPITIATTLEAAAQALYYVKSHIKEQNALLWPNRKRKPGEPRVTVNPNPMLVVIDGMESISGPLSQPDTAADAEFRDVIMESLRRIVRSGADFNVSAVVVTQKPTTQVVPPMERVGMSRLLMGMAVPTLRMMALRNPDEAPVVTSSTPYRLRGVLESGDTEGRLVHVWHSSVADLKAAIHAARER